MIYIQFTYLQSNTHVLRDNFNFKFNVVYYKGGDRIAAIFLFDAILELLNFLKHDAKNSYNDFKTTSTLNLNKYY